MKWYYNWKFRGIIKVLQSHAQSASVDQSASYLKQCLLSVLLHSFSHSISSGATNMSSLQLTQRWGKMFSLKVIKHRQVLRKAYRSICFSLSVFSVWYSAWTPCPPPLVRTTPPMSLTLTLTTHRHTHIRKKSCPGNAILTIHRSSQRWETRNS